MTTQYIKASAAAKHFGVDEDTVRSWLRRGKLRGRIIDRTYLIDQTELQPLTTTAGTDADFDAYFKDDPCKSQARTVKAKRSTRSTET